MSKLSTMPPAGLVVIVVILSLFVLSLIVLFIIYARYSHLASLVGNLNRDNDFLRFVVNDYADASADHSREKTSFRSFKERYEAIKKWREEHKKK